MRGFCQTFFSGCFTFGDGSGIMNHGCKISSNHELPRLKPWNHESREIVKKVMNDEIIIPSIFEAGDYNHI